MLMNKKCKKCKKEYVTDVQIVPVPKCASCDDTEYVLREEYFEYCSDECRFKSIPFYKLKEFIKDKVGGHNGK